MFIVVIEPRFSGTSKLCIQRAFPPPPPHAPSDPLDMRLALACFISHQDLYIDTPSHLFSLVFVLLMFFFFGFVSADEAV